MAEQRQHAALKWNPNYKSGKTISGENLLSMVLICYNNTEARKRPELLDTHMHGEQTRLQYNHKETAKQNRNTKNIIRQARIQVFPSITRGAYETQIWEDMRMNMQQQTQKQGTRNYNKNVETDNLESQSHPNNPIKMDAS